MREALRHIGSSWMQSASCPLILQSLPASGTSPLHRIDHFGHALMHGYVALLSVCAWISRPWSPITFWELRPKETYVLPIKLRTSLRTPQENRHCSALLSLHIWGCCPCYNLMHAACCYGQVNWSKTYRLSVLAFDSTSNFSDYVMNLFLQTFCNCGWLAVTLCDQLTILPQQSLILCLSRWVLQAYQAQGAYNWYLLMINCAANKRISKGTWGLVWHDKWWNG